MDIITQAALGAAIGQAGWRERLGPRALWWGALCGMVPDFDVLSRVWGEWASVYHHRGFTHSLLFAPLACWALGWLGWRLLGKQEEGTLRSWRWLAFWALWTHPMLDVFTTYGTQLLSPLTDRRFAIDGVSIVDPVYTLPLLGALLVGRLTRDRRPELGARLARATLALTTAYLGLGLFMASLARERAAAELAAADLPAIEELRATPTFANVWLWRVVARDTRGDIHIGLHSNLAPEPPIAFSHVAVPDTPLIARAKAHEHGALFHWFAMDMVGYEVEEPADGPTELRMNDLRYGGVRDPTQPFWGAVATFGEDGEVTSVRRVRSDVRRDMGGELSAMWRKIWHGGSS
jgi:inner membrane protein